MTPEQQAVLGQLAANHYAIKVEQTGAYATDKSDACACVVTVMRASGAPADDACGDMERDPLYPQLCYSEAGESLPSW